MSGQIQPAQQNIDAQQLMQMIQGLALNVNSLIDAQKKTDEKIQTLSEIILKSNEETNNKITALSERVDTLVASQQRLIDVVNPSRPNSSGSGHTPAPGSASSSEVHISHPNQQEQQRAQNSDPLRQGIDQQAFTQAQQEIRQKEEEDA